jgi:hypothetical protein
MKKIPPELRLDRLLDALSEDVSLASDAEILEACADLKIQPGMKGSIAYLGLKKGLFFFPYAPAKLTEPIDPPAGSDPSDSPGITRRH